MHVKGPLAPVTLRIEDVLDEPGSGYRRTRLARERRVGCLLAAAVLLVRQTNGHELPVYGPEDFSASLVDVDTRTTGRNHRVGKFLLIDQHKRRVTETSLESQITVASFIFTRCTAICPDMIRQMKRVANATADVGGVHLMSFTGDADHDTPEVLGAFAREKAIDESRWRLVTGDRNDIYQLARKSFFTIHNEGTTLEEDFLHTETVVLIDGERRLRGFYNGTMPHDVDQLIADVRTLAGE